MVRILNYHIFTKMQFIVGNGLEECFKNDGYNTGSLTVLWWFNLWKMFLKENYIFFEKYVLFKISENCMCTNFIVWL